MNKITLLGNVPPKKNSKRIVHAKGRTLLLPSHRYEEWHEEQMYHLLTIVPTKNIYDIEINFTFATKRKCDLTNKAESVMDLLVDGGIIEDDNYKIVPNVSLTGRYEKGIDKTEIVIFESQKEYIENKYLMYIEPILHTNLSSLKANNITKKIVAELDKWT